MDEEAEEKAKEWRQKQTEERAEIRKSEKALKDLSHSKSFYLRATHIR